MSYDITVIGEIYQDHIFSGFSHWPGPGVEVFTEQYQWELGGGAVTTACALAKLDRKVRLIGVVGKSQFPAVQNRLAEFRVSAEHLIQSEQNTGVTVSISTSEDRTFFTYRGANDELTHVLEREHDLLRLAASSHHIHLAFPLLPTIAQEVLRILKSKGATVSLDVGHQVDWLGDSSSIDVIRGVDYLLPNEKEVSLLSGGVKEYLNFCRDLGLRTAVVKLGSAGAVMAMDGKEYHVSAPKVRVLDTTGAGDAFNAGFIEGLLSGASPQGCLDFGCICGSLSTRAAGSLRALPGREQLEELSKEHHVA